jgi:uncharacterized protein (DUF3820 family)
MYRTFSIPFGKHRGKPLCDVPTDYLQWFQATCQDADYRLRQAVKMELQDRRDGVRHEEPDYDGPQRESTEVLDVRTLAGQWYRRLAVEFHPDRGGSHEAMKAVNRGRDLLLEMVGVGR